MFGIIELPTFLLGLLVVVLLPGPNSLYVLTTAMRAGPTKGLQAAAGIFLGDWILLAATALGAASLLTSFPVLFYGFKYLGAGYLAWVGLGLLWRAVQGFRSVSVEDHENLSPEMSKASRGSPFRRALVISLLNPKAILFFVAFLIQFVDPAYTHPLVPFLILGLLVQLFSAVYLVVLIFVGARLTLIFKKHRVLSAGMTGGTGAIFVSFSAKLAMTTLQ